MGDFYELFFADARKGGAHCWTSPLTHTRPVGGAADGRWRACPFIRSKPIWRRLIKLGESVAICEQVGEVGGKGPVERKVVRVVTPGTLTDMPTC
jgi:DNA mismatch repair protein MutS